MISLLVHALVLSDRILSFVDSFQELALSFLNFVDSLQPATRVDESHPPELHSNVLFPNTDNVSQKTNAIHLNNKGLIAKSAS